MIIAGTWGGYINYLRRDKKLINFLTGLSASFLVPIFLNTLNSELLTNISNISRANTNDANKIGDIFIFFGFCLLAAMSAQTFIDNLSSKIGLSEKQVEEKVEQKIEQFSKKTKEEEIKRTLKIAQALMLMGDPGAIEEALDISSQVLEENPLNIQAILLKAVALSKRNLNDDLKKALELINNIIESDEFNTKDNQSKGRAFYNRACFQVLLDNYNEDKVYEDLEKAFSLYPELVDYANDRDQDLKDLRNQSRFKELYNKYKNRQIS